MLEAQDRQLFLDALRPPDGFTLDFAIGTTFSLDLLSLLMAPVAFTLFEVDDDENGRPKIDRTLLLEALRRNSGRIALFCQAGRTQVPSQDSPLFTYLEEAVVEVDPGTGGVFHPKVWALRYTGEDEVRYRLLIASRNLTFDRSWDLLVSLEGPLRDRQRAFAVNNPLGDFIAALPGLAVRPPVSARIAEQVSRFANEIRRVDFEIPPPFDSFSLWAGGVPGAKKYPFQVPRDRVLIVSPFLSARTLERLTDKRHENVLVSVAPSLNDVGHKATGLFNRVAVLGDRAEPEPAEDQPAPSTDDLSGLHAKLFVFDQGWNAELWTGSANATEAAFSKNVEFLVGFTGKKSVCGVDAILGPRQGVTSLSDLLVPYQAGQEKSTNLPTEAEELLDQVRLDLVKLGLRVSVEPDAGTGVYFLRLLAPNGATLPANRPVDVTCWPVSIPSGRAQLLPSTGVGVRFGPVGVDGITSFVAFQVTAEIGDGRASTTFVLNLPIDGAPGDRKERLLRFVLKDSAGVARFIALLLSPDGDDSISVAEPGARTAGQNGAGTGSCEPRLFEQLVQALHRSPERLDAIARLIEELGKDPDHDSLFPKGFELIWPPIWAARQGLKA